MDSFQEELAFLFKNKALNAESVEGRFLEKLRKGDIEGAISLMQNHDTDVDLAIEEYYPSKHLVNRRRDKRRKRGTPYISQKLPRKRQQFINEIALFFLLNTPIRWRQLSDTREQFDLFKRFLRDTRFNSTMRQAKRLAGAETEAAKLYHIYRNDDGKPDCRVVVLARSTGYRLRPLIDQFGKMQAFAYGYLTKDGAKNVQHWDIKTKDYYFNCTMGRAGWQVETYKNPIGKIPVVYYRQKKEWDGVQSLCDREEDVLSRQADNNNYFSDPIAKASADVIQSIADPDQIGKFIQLRGDNSTFDYVDPPQVADGWRTEKDDLKSAILNDSFTPDFSYEGIKGYGTLTGAALRNALTIGYIKRNLNLETYEEAVDRERSIIVSVLQLMHPELDWDAFNVEHLFSDPFSDDRQTVWSAVGNAVAQHIMSTETAVSIVGEVDDTDKEVAKIQGAAQEE